MGLIIERGFDLDLVARTKTSLRMRSVAEPSLDIVSIAARFCRLLQHTAVGTLNFQPNTIVTLKSLCSVALCSHCSTHKVLAQTHDMQKGCDGCVLANEARPGHVKPCKS
eukprot:3801516-Amphidinium_carterae.1